MQKKKGQYGLRKPGKGNYLGRKLGEGRGAGSKGAGNRLIRCRRSGPASHRANILKVGNLQGIRMDRQNAWARRTCRGIAAVLNIGHAMAGFTW